MAKKKGAATRATCLTQSDAESERVSERENASVCQCVSVCVCLALAASGSGPGTLTLSAHDITNQTGVKSPLSSASRKQSSLFSFSSHPSLEAHLYTQLLASAAHLSSTCITTNSTHFIVTNAREAHLSHAPVLSYIFLCFRLSQSTGHWRWRWSDSEWNQE